jgi:hypothetical protein
MTGIDDVLRRQSEIIDTVGWAVTAVLPTVDDPATTRPFAYTVGLTAHDYPELLIAGLDPATSQALLNDLAERVYDKAERFTHGQHIDNLIVGYNAVIVDGPPTPQLWPAPPSPATAPTGYDCSRSSGPTPTGAPPGRPATPTTPTCNR